MAAFIHTDATFAQALPQTGQLVVVFKKDGCRPCAALMPWFDKLAAERPDIQVLRADWSKTPFWRQKFNVRKVPSVYWVTTRDGAIVRAEPVTNNGPAMYGAVVSHASRR